MVIDWEDPINNKLVLCYQFGAQNAGPLRSLVAPDSTPTIVHADSYWTGSPGGRGALAADGKISTGGPTFDLGFNKQTYSIAFNFWKLDAPSYATHSIWGAPATNPICRYEILDTSIRIAYGGTSRSLSNVSLHLNQHNCVVFSHRKTDGIVRGHANGKEATGSTYIYIGLNDQFRYNGKGTWSSFNNLKRIDFYIRLWKRELSQSEARRLYEDMNAGLRPANDPIFIYSAAGDVEVSATTALLTTATYNATVENPSSGTDVQAGVANLTLAEAAATVSLDIDVSAAVQALTLGASTATVQLNKFVDGSTVLLTLATYGATVEAPSGGANVVTTPQNLTLTALPATVSLDIVVSADVASLALATLAGGVALNRFVDAGYVAFTSATYDATFTRNVEASAAVVGLSLSALPATVTNPSQDTEVAATTAELYYNTLDASVDWVSSNVDVQAVTATLTLTKHKAEVDGVRPVVEIPKMRKRLPRTMVATGVGSDDHVLIEQGNIRKQVPATDIFAMFGSDVDRYSSLADHAAHTLPALADVMDLAPSYVFNDDATYNVVVSTSDGSTINGASQSLTVGPSEVAILTAVADSDWIGFVVAVVES